jgi:hypothetical protein
MGELVEDTLILGLCGNSGKTRRDN